MAERDSIEKLDLKLSSFNETNYMCLVQSKIREQLIHDLLIPSFNFSLSYRLSGSVVSVNSSHKRAELTTQRG